MLGILALLYVKDHLPTLFKYMKHLLEICDCFTNYAHILPTKLDKCCCFWSGKFGFGQGKVREISGNFAFYNLWEPWNIVTPILYRGSYMSAHVLLNLLNELGKRDKDYFEVSFLT